MKTEDSVLYIDLHTHQPAAHANDIGIVNVIVKADEEAFLPEGLCSAGIHPWYITDKERQFQKLKELASLPQVVAIGEIGLDKLSEVPMPVQSEVFLAEALLAERLEKPVFIHCVKAWDELLAVKKQINPQMPWVIHGFRGNSEQAKQLIRQGFWLSFGAKFNAEALASAFPSHCFAETDDKQIDIRDVYSALAASLQIPVADLAAGIETNFKAVVKVFL